MKKRTGLIAAALSAAMIFGSAPAPVLAAEPATESENKTTEDKTGEKDSDKKKEEEEEDRWQLDPTKDTWDTNGASSDPAPKGPFDEEKSSGLNRVDAYFKSNQFKMIYIIVTAIAGVITVGSQIIALIISVNPAAKAQFESLFK